LDWAHPLHSMLTCRLISRPLSLRLNKQMNTQDMIAVAEPIAQHYAGYIVHSTVYLPL
jgi:hypothetical protein